MKEINQGEFWVVNSDNALKMFVEHITNLYQEKKYVTLKWKAGKTRTTQQNNALHVYCRLMSEKLNAEGLDMKKTLKQDAEIPWTTELVKEYLWKPIQSAVTGEKSSSDVSASDYDEIHKHLSHLLSTKFNVYVPFPSRK